MNQKPARITQPAGHCPVCGAPILANWYETANYKAEPDFRIGGYIEAGDAIRRTCECYQRARNLQAMMEAGTIQDEETPPVDADAPVEVTGPEDRPTVSYEETFDG